VNFPEVALPDVAEHHRILHVHENVPGVLHEINELFAEEGVNVGQQVLRTLDDVGYLVADVDESCTLDMVKRLRRLEHTIRARPLF
jgi:D-3-phosphoglycerate dehydrogenase